MLKNETEDSYYKVITMFDRSLSQSAPGITKCARNLLQSAQIITKCDRGLLQSESGITKCNRLLLQSASGITKCNSYYKVRRNTRGVQTPPEDCFCKCISVLTQRKVKTTIKEYSFDAMLKLALALAKKQKLALDRNVNIVSK